METTFIKDIIEPIFAVDPKFDRVFLELFSPIKNNSKKNLINFINAIFEEKGLNPVIELSPFSENLPAFQFTTESRHSRIDIIAKDSTNRLINVEIQRATQEYFFERATFHACRLYGGQIGIGEPYTKLNPTILINILDFVLFDDSDAQQLCLSSHKFICNELKKSLKESPIELFFLELPKLTFWNSSSKSRSWSALLFNNKKYEEYIMETKECLHAYEDAQKMSKDPAIVAAYKDHLAWINDETSIRATDIVLAERRGMEKGVELADYNKIVKYLSMGESIETIAKNLLLTINDVHILLKKYGK